MRRIAAVSFGLALLAAPQARAQVTFQTVPPAPAQPGGQPGRAPQPNADLPPGTAVLRGHVFASDTGQPLRKAQVRILQANAQPNGGLIRENRLATTDAQGAYEFKELRAGRYTLTASKGSYVTLQYGQTRPNEAGKPLEILDAQVVERVDFTLPHGGVITGRILDEFGEPLSDVMIAPQRYMYVQGQRRLVGAGRTAVTDDLGEFRIFGVPPGQYYLQATFRNFSLNNSDDRNGYAPLFFPGTTDAANAQRLTIAAGGEIHDVMMTMRPVRAVRVSGMLFDSKGQPTNGMIVVANTSAFATVSFAGPVRPDGTFTVNGLAPGEYVIRSMPMGGRPGDAEVANLQIAVGSEDITDLQLRAAAPSVARGRVIVDPGAAVSVPQRLMLSMAPVTFTPMAGPATAMVNDDWSFELKSPAGSFRMMLGPGAGGFAIRSVRLNGTDVTDSGFEMKPNQDVSGLEVELTNKLSTISGVVTNARGDALKEYSTIIFSQDQARWSIGRYTGVGRPDQDGRYKIAGLPAGEYYIVAVDHLDAGEANDPEVLERLRSKASILSINEGDTKSVDLRMQTSS